ncbi:hypothetical protein ANCCAN_27254 [Ancylostoma caninum]|uniref:Integrase catalytic domain-containing protein n=1 Tax=Ancylostoma caninum TaxID=29170 RepID=A0A368F4K6_ANCCA|nr:hypothetical protein ANCCAN_27254 [Ancylostoma caninum]
MVTRAIHLESVADNSAVGLISAFRKFKARRGAPDLIISDDAPTFKLGSETLTNDLSKNRNNPLVHSFVLQERLHWKFITPFSPWKGRFYERLVGSVKNALKETIRKAILTSKMLETLVIEIEGVLDSRPLTAIGNTASTEETATGNLNAFGMFGRKNTYKLSLKSISNRKPMNLEQKLILKKGKSFSAIKNP